MKKNFFSLSFLSLILYLCSCDNSKTGTAKQNEADPVPEVKSIFINGDSINYIDIGKGDPVVFVHGTLGDYRAWEAQMDTFAKNHRVIAYSRRFAYPNRQIINDSADYTVIPHAKDLAEFIKTLNLEPIHLVGHSYGAFTALLTTINHPNLIRSLTLGEPPIMSLLQNVPGGDTIANNIIAKTIIAAEAFKNNNNEKAVTVFLGGVMGDSLFLSKVPQQGQDFMMNNLLKLRGIVITKAFSSPITCDDLKKIKTPILLLEGNRSPLFLTSITSELDRCLDNEERATLSNSSHGLQAEKPSEFNNKVLGFIDKH
ncbi:MAG: alpha/beta hydrolase [Saprospiraceae bacterium]